jgi:hypothetical protein
MGAKSAYQKTPTSQATREKNSHTPSQSIINSDVSFVSYVVLNTLHLILISSAKKIDLRDGVILCVPFYKGCARRHILAKPGVIAITLISTPTPFF